MKTAATRRRDRRRTLQVGIAGLITLAAILVGFGGNSTLLERLSGLVPTGPAGNAEKALAS